jgi:hypothetical protein
VRPEPVFARDVVAWINTRIAGRATAAELERALSRTSFLASSRVRAQDGSAQPLSAWIDSLPGSGAMRARLDGRAAGAELVVVTWPTGSRGWRQRWERIEQARAAPWFDGWLIEEGATAETPADPSVAEVSARLRAALESLVALGARFDLGGWAQYFARALSMLDASAGQDRDAGGHPAGCLLPPGLPRDAHALAHAAEHSDAFGGMGSWNDFSLEDAAGEAARSEASSRLFAAVQDALAAVAHAI